MERKRDRVILNFETLKCVTLKWPTLKMPSFKMPSVKLLTSTVDFGCGFYDLQARVVCIFFHYWFHRQNLIIGLNYLKREERVRFNLSRFNRYQDSLRLIPIGLPGVILKLKREIKISFGKGLKVLHRKTRNTGNVVLNFMFIDS
jgi:hypothetical protein